MEPSRLSAAQLAPTSLHPPPCKASVPAFLSPLPWTLQVSCRAVKLARMPRCSRCVLRVRTSSTKRPCPRYMETAQYAATALLISHCMPQCALCWANYTSTADARSCLPCPPGAVSALGAVGTANYTALPLFCPYFTSGCSELKVSEAQLLPSPTPAPQQGPSPAPQAPRAANDEVRVGGQGRGRHLALCCGLVRWVCVPMRLDFPFTRTTLRRHRPHLLRTSPPVQLRYALSSSSLSYSLNSNRSTNANQHKQCRHLHYQ